MLSQSCIYYILCICIFYRDIYIYTYILIHICAFTNTHIYGTTWYAASLIVNCRLRSVTRFLSGETDGTKDAFAGPIFWGVEKVTTESSGVPSFDPSNRNLQKDPSNSRSKSGRWVSFYHSLEWLFFCWVSQDSSKILVKTTALDFKGRISGARSGQIHAKTHLSDAETTWSK